MSPPRVVRRGPLLLLAIFSLLAGILGGLGRLGFAIGAELPPAIALHGPLMLVGFLGTVIGLERAVAVGAGWAYLAPLLTGAGAMSLLAGGPAETARLLAVAGGAAMVASLSVGVYRLPSRWSVTLLLGGIAFLVGCSLWAFDGSLARALLWWQAFLVLTIAGERLELSKLIQPPPIALGVFAGLVALVLTAAAVGAVAGDLGARFSGAAWLGLALWLVRWDLARKSLDRPGLPRFIAVALLVAHAWLGVAGVLLLLAGDTGAGFLRDAALHTLLLGFVFSMIFGHAPIIFPAILGVSLAYRSRFWVHLALLHASVALRVGADLLGWLPGRALAGAASAAAILLFLLQTVSVLGRGDAPPALNRNTGRSQKTGAPRVRPI